MTTPPRWQVLNAAHRIIEEGLAGLSDDPVLNRLADFYRIKEYREEQISEARRRWEQLKLNPFFKLGLFYAFVFALAIVARLLQERGRGLHR